MTPTNLRSHPLRHQHRPVQHHATVPHASLAWFSSVRASSLPRALAQRARPATQQKQKSRRSLAWPLSRAAWHVARAGRAGTARRLLSMKRILLTGMSGTGKSSVIRALADLGYKAIDTDDGWCQKLPDGRQRWREDAITALLATEDTDILFLAGCEETRSSSIRSSTTSSCSARQSRPCCSGSEHGPATLMARHLATLTVSSATPRTSSLYYGRQPITKSQRPCRSTTS